MSSKTKGIFDLKHHQGGITDIEFIVQYLVLAQAANYPALSLHTGNIRLLENLAQLGLIPIDDANILIAAYRAYRYYGHQKILQGNRPFAQNHEFLDERAQIVRIWHEIME